MDYDACVSLYHIVDRTVRENDVDLFTYATNHHIYARWMSKYQLDLKNLSATHPGLKEMLAAWIFSIQ